uniref:Aap1 n=1 Tax=Arundo donax TaxID=35708 RepID=A0A0A9CS34_ARUDO
MGENMERGF